jgi:hypothetical protein
VAQARGYVERLTCDDKEAMYSLVGQTKAGNEAMRCNSVLADEADDPCGSSECFVRNWRQRPQSKVRQAPQPDPAQLKDLETRTSSQ